MLEPHNPSSPTRPPVEHLYFTVHDDEGETVLFLTHGFGAFYAVKRWLEEIMDPHPDIKESWINDNTILLRHKPTNHTLTIKGSYLEEATNYQYTKEEAKWTIPYPDTQTVERLTTFYNLKMRPSSHMKPSEDTNTSKPSSTKPPQRHKSTKPPKEGYITVAELASKHQIQPNKARNILRKANIQKPEDGWTFKKDDPMVQKIEDLLKAG